MDLMRNKLRGLIEDQASFKKNGVRVKFIGKLDLFPKDIQELAKDSMDVTSGNTDWTLNIAIGYTSREEMTNAIQRIANSVDRDEIQASDISADLIERRLYISEMSDLLIRTSGEVRLSDFLLWQTAYSTTYFTQVLWPDLSLTSLLAGIFLFQVEHSMIHEYLKHLSRQK